MSISDYATHYFATPKKPEDCVYSSYTYRREGVGTVLYECWYTPSNMTIVTSRERLIQDEFWNRRKKDEDKEKTNSADTGKA